MSALQKSVGFVAFSTRKKGNLKNDFERTGYSMHGKHDSMSTLVIFIVLGLVFLLIDPCTTIMIGLLGLLAYGYLKSQ